MHVHEAALQTMVKDAIEIINGDGEWVGPIPETCDVGESQSNGSSERGIHMIEDMTRPLSTLGLKLASR